MPWDRNARKSPIYSTPQHRRARAAAVKAFREGDPCALCGHGMYGPTRNLHLDHDPDGNGYRGLAHGTERCQDCGRRCNIEDGARRGRARQDGWLDWPPPGPDAGPVTKLQW